MGAVTSNLKPNLVNLFYSISHPFLMAFISELHKFFISIREYIISGYNEGAC